jgi:hypothetical protein
MSYYYGHQKATPVRNVYPLDQAHTRTDDCQSECLQQWVARGLVPRDPHEAYCASSCMSQAELIRQQHRKRQCEINYMADKFDGPECYEFTSPEECNRLAAQRCRNGN